MKKHYFSRVDRQVAVLLGVVLVLFSVSIYFVSISIFSQATRKSLTGRVESVHAYIENQLTTEEILEIDGKEDMDKEIYRNLKSKLEEIRMIGDLMYLYTAKKNEAGDLVYVVDGLPDTAEDFRYPGDLIEPEIQLELEQALRGETVLPEKILGTGWGNIFIAYYPLHDCSGKVIGALGMEIKADAEAEAFENISKALIGTGIFFCTVAFAIAILAFRRISNPLYRDMSNTDFMTSLKNRNSYETDRENLKARKKRENLTVAVIDVNNLKLANDRLGHDVGDECIITAAKLLHGLESDCITAYRYGGDEFVMLLENYPDTESILKKAKNEFQKFAEGLAVPVALAVGYATFDPALDHGLEDTQKRADERMYEDKMRIKATENGSQS